MGTVEPLYNSSVEEDKIAFIRGAIEKYKNTSVDKKEIFDYILNQLNT